MTARFLSGVFAVVTCAFGWGGSIQEQQDTVEAAAEWVEWYRALEVDDLDQRVRSFYETQQAPLVEWLGEVALSITDDDPRIRALACFAIGSHYDAAPELLSTVEQACSDPVPLVRFAATVACLRIKQDASGYVQPLVDFLAADDAGVRIGAARYLMTVDEVGTRAIEEIGGALPQEADSAVRLAWAQLLRDFAARPGAADALTVLLNSPDDRLRAVAVSAQIRAHGMTGEWIPRAAFILRHGTPECVGEILHHLRGQEGAFPPAIDSALRTCLISTDADVRSSALIHLSFAREGVEWEAGLIGLTDNDPGVRSLAVTLLGKEQCDGPASLLTTALARAVKDTDEWVRQGAMRALLSYGDEAGAHTRSIAAGLDIADAGARADACSFLGRHGGTQSPWLPDLEQFASSNQGYPTVVAAWACDAIRVDTEFRHLAATLSQLTYNPAILGMIAPCYPELCDPLEHLTQHADAAVRAGATYYRVLFHGLDDRRVRDCVCRAAHDEDPAVRRVAAAVLSQISSSHHSDLTYEALQALERDADEAVRNAATAGSGND